MTITKFTVLQAALAAIAAIGCLFVSEKALLTKPGSLVTEANAIIGRPLTPVSYAGVARRTTARDVTYGAAAATGAAVAAGAAVHYAAPVYAAPVYAAPPACYQVANAYGQLTTVCP